MHKKSILIILFCAGITILVLVATARVMQFKPEMDFRYALLEIDYDFAYTYTKITEEILDMDSTSASEYLLEYNLEQYIERLYEIIDEFIIVADKWQEESNLKIPEPNDKICDLIIVERAYCLSKTAIAADSEELLLFESLYKSISSTSRNHRIYLDSIKLFIDMTMFERIAREFFFPTYYFGSSLPKSTFIEIFREYLEDVVVPTEKKEWLQEYVKRNYYTDFRGA